MIHFVTSVDQTEQTHARPSYPDGQGDLPTLTAFGFCTCRPNAVSFRIDNIEDLRRSHSACQSRWSRSSVCKFRSYFSM
jgi:hypothetical protein